MYNVEDSPKPILFTKLLLLFKKGNETMPTLAKPQKKNSPKRTCHKIETVSKHAEIQQNETLCSICSVCIQGYIPEYFLGEKFNAACESCKSKDSSWALDQLDPFSSFADSSIPTSLASHWMPVKYN